MRHPFAVLILLVACSGGQTPSPPEPATVIAVSAPIQPASPQPGAVAEPPVDSPAPAAMTLERCVPDLRSVASCAGDAAESAYAAALEAERAGDLGGARKTYFSVIQRHPGSRCLPLTYLAFAEMFHEESRNDDSKRELARAAYSEVLKYPPASNRAWAYASYQLGSLCLHNQADSAQALADFKRALGATVSWPQQACAHAIGEAAAQGLVRAYASAGRPERAWSFFTSTSPDRAWELSLALADEYAGQGQGDEAVAVLLGALQGTNPLPAMCARVEPVLGRVRAARPRGGLAALEASLRARCP